MPAAADAKNTVEATQEAVRRYMDESASFGRAYFGAWSAMVQAGLQTTFDMENAAVKASRQMMDSSIQANMGWFEQAAEAMRKGQEITAKMTTAGLNFVEAATPIAWK